MVDEEFLRKARESAVRALVRHHAPTGATAHQLEPAMLAAVNTFRLGTTAHYAAKHGLRILNRRLTPNTEGGSVIPFHGG